MRSVALVASAWLLLSPVARGESRGETPQPAAEAPAARDDGRRTLRLFPVNLLRGTGATLGYIVGRTVVRVNGGAIGGTKGPQVSLNPAVGRRTRALLVAVTF
jgi:hypothetical protein